MVELVKHQEIDKKKWDDCIRHSPNGRVYALSWYLDCLSPGWAALVEGDYRSVFPLTQRKKYGIPYLYQPPFCQQLGLFSEEGCSEEKLKTFLAALPDKYKVVEIALNAALELPKGHSGKTRSNYALPLRDDYDQLSGAYSKNAHRNLKDAQAAYMQWCKTGTGQLTGLFRLNRGANIRHLKTRDYQRLEELIHICGTMGIGQINGLCDKNGHLLAGAFWLRWRGRHYFLFSGMSAKGREHKAMFFLIDDYIRKHAGKNEIIDFEGSDIPGVERFYKGFGAVRESYPFLRINRLPSLLRWLK